MGTKQESEHWDRHEWAPDDAARETTKDAEVWNRRQVEVDNTGTGREGEGRESFPPDMARVPDDESADQEHISGRGMPSGESHWQRVDDTKRD